MGHHTAATSGDAKQTRLALHLQYGMTVRTRTPTPQDSSPPVEKTHFIATVAYALWEDRKRQNLPDDPEADWYSAERLIEDLWAHRPQEGGSDV